MAKNKLRAVIVQLFLLLSVLRAHSTLAPQRRMAHVALPWQSTPVDVFFSSADTKRVVRRGALLRCALPRDMQGYSVMRYPHPDGLLQDLR